jgi:hypothetical protein
MFKQIRLIFWFGILILATACGSPVAATSGPQVWIDAPLNSMALPLAPYEIVAHADDPGGIAKFEFTVNGSVIASTAGTSGSLSIGRQVWNPPAPGEYVIEVRALGISDSWGPSAQVKVTVGEIEATLTSTPLFTSTLEPSATMISTATPLLTATATATGTSSMPVFTLSKNANCRQGPSQVYEVVTSFSQGQSISIEGKNKDNTWWLVRIPTGGRCWISGVTGNTTGNIENVPIVEAPPAPLPTSVQGCYVYDPNQNPVCTVPCPANAQPGGECKP